MASGIISPTLIPGWPAPAVGAREQLDATLISGGFAPSILRDDGLFVGDVTTATNFLAPYIGSASELAFWQTLKQKQLDALLDGHFDLKAFIRAGTSTTITATNVGTFLATINNNYRSLRASIAAATTVAQLQAININSGWPANP